jgi:CoA:oxalate CoA-transferase
VADVAVDPQVAARNMIVSIADPTMGTLRVAGNPIKLSGVPEPSEHDAPPEIDEDRAAVLDLLSQSRQ